MHGSLGHAFFGELSWTSCQSAVYLRVNRERLLDESESAGDTPDLFARVTGTPLGLIGPMSYELLVALKN